MKGKKKTAKEWSSLAGRRDWHGVHPATRVMPNKKKPKPLRKAKHKGRLPEAGLSFLPLSFSRALAACMNV